MADDISTEMMRKMRARKRAATREAVGHAAQIVGGAAETMRTGTSAAETFAKRRPSYKQDVMTRKEKLDKSKPYIKELELGRRFDYRMDLTKSQEILRAKLKREEAIAADLNRQRTQNITASQHRARNSLTLRNQQIKENLKNQDEQTKLSPQAQARVDQVRSKDDYARAEAAPIANHRRQQHKELKRKAGRKDATTEDIEAYEKSKEKNVVLTGKEDPTEDELVDGISEDPQIQARGKERSIEDSKAAADEIMDSPHYDDKDVDISVKVMASKAGGTTDEVVQERQAEYEQREQASRDRREELDEEYKVLDNKRARESRAIGKGAPESALTPADEMDFSEIEQAGVEDIEASEPGEQSDGGASMPIDPNGFMGVRGRRRPLGSQARFQESLAIIDEFPEFKPSRAMKEQIMATKEYQDWMAKHGFTDPDLSWKEFKRDVRVAEGKRKADMRTARLKKRGREMEALKPKTVRTRSAVPVQGDTSPSDPQPKDKDKEKGPWDQITYGDAPIVVDQ